ncbi:luciferase domain-containing protein [Jannaschia formosa]|uniref:luciferase domain-containing protein n=1 Tax=Jannaschia formosa TaxID=2259592 RepID=UPI000E1B93FF|nr:luciferase family protein [Jannaschia formosa]TFL16562.1 hypothetical protein DR046_19375 [Jannaschia formosa]
MLQLEPRSGKRPVTGAEPPHLQHSQTSPVAIREAMAAWAFSGALPGVREEATRISVPSSRALWLDEAWAVAPGAFMPPPGSREFAHLHEDGSLHLTLSPRDEAEVLAKGWGEAHPWKHRGINEILVYAPRDEQEAAVVRHVLRASYAHAIGKSD